MESSPAHQPFTIELLWAARHAYPLSSLTGSGVAPRAPARVERVLRIAKDGARAFAVSVWLGLYFALIGVWIVVPAARALIRHHLPQGIPPAIVGLLAISAAVYLSAVTWGVPGPGWAADEVSPADLLRMLEGSVYREWWSQNPKYPPAHFYLLALTLPPFLAWRWLDPSAFLAAPSLEALHILFRSVSVSMALSIVLSVYGCGSYLYSRTSAFVAASLVALTLPMVYFSKIATLDIPFTFWFSLSLVSFLRILVDDSRIDYTLFAVFAALAVCTKDQAYALYGLPIVAVICLAYARANGRSPIDRLGSMLRSGRLPVAAFSALVLFALCQNLLFNFGGFLFHLRYIAGPGAEPYRMFEPTLAGEWQLWRAVWMLVRVSMGWPAFLLCVLGIASSVWRPGPSGTRLWWLMLPIVSYYLAFLAPIGYAYDRFLLPVFIPLALGGGFLISRVEQAQRLRPAMFVAVAAVLAYSIAYATSVDVAMMRDSRYSVEDWMRGHVEAGATIGVVGPPDHLPRTSGFTARSVSPNAARLLAAPFDYVIANVDWVSRFAPGLPEHDLYRDLREGRLGYRPAFEARTPIRFAGMTFGDRFEPFGSTGYSTLTKLNPHLIVFKRRYDDQR